MADHYLRQLRRITSQQRDGIHEVPVVSECSLVYSDLASFTLTHAEASTIEAKRGHYGLRILREWLEEVSKASPIHAEVREEEENCFRILLEWRAVRAES